MSKPVNRQWERLRYLLRSSNPLMFIFDTSLLWKLNQDDLDYFEYELRALKERTVNKSDKRKISDHIEELQRYMKKQAPMSGGYTRSNSRKSRSKSKKSRSKTRK